ncbi:hypothetical protein A2W67_03305 [Candidatus Nomurabacteria bacterium RIFCSPLOWO2_02_40_28]|uniref:Polymerase III subunit delta protein n=2 Tax=Candidatus Nomuraibacteriota TaxID=1752729 RepID=A0A837HWZ5_9BACT|nr:MAG: polymerase III subunit delta protein [Candidatus Nomurabacteria bacterium GW2011_GWD2_39_12]KKR20962.1 MAG: polymerase III subunit delta protein [Candidatus Nomurabacteria bacterium GW2011_GWC2_39_41]KKR36964.1 MAG: polymerase III subunit delta protein [Candidatus Nomurabacteria bacterium GW2011_GWE2_40_10]KKR38911.1 MAG: polymerase III subunit delta protein [Candidatus Nomurabacteria bacterium GW2011_GWB1_40_11]KKR40153.1 MAG: polymerase III subunit delta protein [Parcubacteria group b
MFLKHLDKNNLHHAYLIEGNKDGILPEILKFMQGEELIQINLDSFKLDDARELKSLGVEKANTEGKKIFIISTNSFLLEAQQALLKLLEEPILNTHFFLIIPDINSLLTTFRSRFYLIKNSKEENKSENAVKFIKMSLQQRIDFLKELLAENDGEQEDRSVDSARFKALNFLNELETSLVSRTVLDTTCFEHFFKVREFLRMPGSSPKTLMESVAIMIPNL